MELLPKVLSFVFSVIVLSRRRTDPPATLAWVLSFILIPYASIPLYLLVGYQNFRRRKRLKPHPTLERKLSGHGTPTPEHVLSPEMAKLMMLAEKQSGFPGVGKNKITLFNDANHGFEAIAKAIATAKKSIHMQYYIFQPDATGLFFRDALIEKAKQGVECRLLVDDVGSFSLKKPFIKPLLDAGVKFARFWPLTVSRPWGVHLRNHRKLVVIDGELGFMGSQNVGNEYLTLRRRRGHRQLAHSWKDTQVRIEGPAANQLQTIFLEDWIFTTKEVINRDDYFSAAPAHGGHSWTQSLPTGPDENQNTLQMILMQAILQANRRITIATPYFIPNSPLMLVMESCISRGVKVDILLPEKSDNWLTDNIVRSWLPKLIDLGVNVHFYKEAFLHAKVVTVDDQLTILGSANMDERSFRLNFEITQLIYDKEVTLHQSVVFDHALAHSRLVTPTQIRHPSLLKRLRDGALRVLSPLL